MEPTFCVPKPAGDAVLSLDSGKLGKRTLVRSSGWASPGLTRVRSRPLAEAPSSLPAAHRQPSPQTPKCSSNVAHLPGSSRVTGTSPETPGQGFPAAPSPRGAPQGDTSPRWPSQKGPGFPHLATAHDVGVLRQQIHHLPFALVAPLRSQHHSHPVPSRPRPGAAAVAVRQGSSRRAALRDRHGSRQGRRALRRLGRRTEPQLNCCGTARDMRRKKEPEAGPAPASPAATLRQAPPRVPPPAQGGTTWRRSDPVSPKASTAATPGPRPHPLLAWRLLPGETRESRGQGAGLTESSPRSVPRPSASLGFQIPAGKGLRPLRCVELQFPACNALRGGQGTAPRCPGRQILVSKSQFCFLCLNTWVS